MPARPPQAKTHLPILRRLWLAVPQVYCLRTLRAIEAGKSVEEFMDGELPDGEPLKLMSRATSGEHPFVKATEDTL